MKKRILLAALSYTVTQNRDLGKPYIEEKLNLHNDKKRRVNATGLSENPQQETQKHKTVNNTQTNVMNCF